MDGGRIGGCLIDWELRLRDRRHWLVVEHLAMRAVLLTVAGGSMIGTAAMLRRSARDSDRIPLTVRMLGRRGSVEEWRKSIHQVIVVATVAGFAFFVAGVVVGLVALLA